MTARPTPRRLPILRRLSVAWMLMLGLLVAVPSWADSKLGVVDLQKVLRSTNAGKAAQKKFEDLRKAKQGQLETKERDLAKRQKELMAGRQELEQAAQAAQGKVTEELKAKIVAWEDKGRKFEQDLMELDKKKRDTLEELAKKEGELLKPIEDIIKQKVEAIAKERGLVAVLNRQVMVYAAETIDITQEVIKRCDGR